VAAGEPVGDVAGTHGRLFCVLFLSLFFGVLVLVFDVFDEEYLEKQWRLVKASVLIPEGWALK
jgi:hypothetical protein